MAGVKGRGGQNRLSADEHQLRGNFRPERHGALALAPTSAPARPQPPLAAPRGLSRAARAAWREYMREFTDWSASDLELLELALRAKDRAAQCRRRIAREGLTLRGPRGATRLHPLVRVERTSVGFMLNAFKTLRLDS